MKGNELDFLFSFYKQCYWWSHEKNLHKISYAFYGLLWNWDRALGVLEKNP